MISDAAKTLSKEGRKIIIVRNMAHGLVMLYQCYAPWMITHAFSSAKRLTWPSTGRALSARVICRPAGLYVTRCVFLASL
jgi:branched-subunit amino acid ABC-type transport system permease component